MRRAAIYVFGSLCKGGHDFEGTGFSLRYKTGHCVECVKAAVAERMKDPDKLAHQRAVTKLKGQRNRVARLAQSKASYQRNIEKRRAAGRANYLAKIEIKRLQSNEYRAKNLEARREKDKAIKRDLRKNNPERIRAYAREFYARNSIQLRIRNRVSKALRAQGVIKNFRIGDIGIDVEAISKHIGPCPGAPSEWHIDHIRPLCSFDFSDKAQLLEAFKPENHQWLTAIENIRKHGKYDPQSSPR